MKRNLNYNCYFTLFCHDTRIYMIYELRKKQFTSLIMLIRNGKNIACFLIYINVYFLFKFSLLKHFNKISKKQQCIFLLLLLTISTYLMAKNFEPISCQYWIPWKYFKYSIYNWKLALCWKYFQWNTKIANIFVLD